MEIQVKGIPQAQQKIAEQLQALRLRVNAAAREGMAEAITMLRQRVVEAMYAAGIQRKSGGTEEAILTGNGKPEVYGGDDSMRLTGVVTTVKADQAGNDPRMPMGSWLGQGTVHAAIAGKLMSFVAPDGTRIFTRRISGYQTAGKPFLNPATDSFEPEFQQMMREKIAAAVNP